MISYNLPARTSVVIHIFTSVGEKVTTLVEQTQDAGFHTVHWDGRDATGNPMPQGPYVYRLNLVQCQQVRLISLAPQGDALAES